MFRNIIIYLTFSIFAFSCKFKKEYKTMTAKDKNGYEYEYVTNDPSNMRLYTLDNGLKVYLADDKTQPKLKTYIAVNAGSNEEPEDNTGLAHYLEHMLFKGTSEIGTKNWQKEKELIAKISDLYEKHKLEKSPNKRKKIYKQIDKLSVKAANYAIPGEYDKMLKSIGATGTNAHTWYNETVYHNTIPSNELEKWLKIEKERFSEMVLRLFHTELETVYEEFNMSQDRDGARSYISMFKALFPKSPYGRATIGLGEHLKSPSMVAIHEFFDKYYIPNNMAICISGDLDYENTISLIDKYFGEFKSKELKRPKFSKEFPIKGVIEKEIFGPEQESIMLAYRLDDMKKKSYLKIVNNLFSNGIAGLIDLNVNKKQKVLSATFEYNLFRDYGVSYFEAIPKQNQTLDDVKDIIMEQIDNIKQGKFDGWLLEAVINDIKKDRISQYDSYSGKADLFYRSFINDIKWEDYVKEIQDMSQITKEDIVKFANDYFKDDNYVAVYKREGKAKNKMKIAPPSISKFDLNSSDKSNFFKSIEKIKSESIKPLFVDFKTDINKEKIKGKQDIYFIENKSNDLFTLNFTFDMGKNNDKRLSHINYINYLGTDKYTADQIAEKFYKIAIDFSIRSSVDESRIVLSGLKENIGEAIKLLKHILFNVKPDKQAWGKMVDRIIKSREDNKKNNQVILSALVQYGIWGKNSNYRNIYSKDELDNFDLDGFINMVKSLLYYKHDVFYYGKDLKEVTKILSDEMYFNPEISSKDYPKPIEKYKKIEVSYSDVYFVNYDMVQAMMIQLNSGWKNIKDNKPYFDMYQEYYGAGLSSVFFREIREKQALAYSTSSMFVTPSKKEELSTLYAFAMVQAAKLPKAMKSIGGLLNNMFKSEPLFEIAKGNIIKKINTQRITKQNIYYTYRDLKNLGIDYDWRKDIYDKVMNSNIDDFEKFFNENIKGTKFNYIVIGNKKDINMKLLSKYGKLKEVDLDYIFNYR